MLALSRVATHRAVAYTFDCLVRLRPPAARACLATPEAHGRSSSRCGGWQRQHNTSPSAHSCIPGCTLWGAVRSNTCADWAARRVVAFSLQSAMQGRAAQKRSSSSTPCLAFDRGHVCAHALQSTSPKTHHQAPTLQRRPVLLLLALLRRRLARVLRMQPAHVSCGIALSSQPAIRCAATRRARALHRPHLPCGARHLVASLWLCPVYHDVVFWGGGAFQVTSCVC